jgi:hypothetical protein
MRATAPRLSTYLTEFPTVAGPDVSGALAIFPLIGPAPTLEYLSFAQARVLGARVIELEQGASVRDLTIENPGDLPVLLFEGEEVLGAQQNRTFDVSALVAAHSKLQVPVSCVEAGRWHGARHAEDFAPAPQAAYPALRRMKNTQVRSQLEAHAAPRADQQAVWAEVRATSDRRGAASPTGALSDVFEHRRERLDEICSAMSMTRSQTGMLVAIGGRFAVLDRVSQPDVLDSLFAPLVRGYALDALEAPAPAPADPPSVDEARATLERILACRVTEYDGIGLGRDARVADGAITGAGVLVADELVQLSAFIEDADGATPAMRRGRINRPSRWRA